MVDSISGLNSFDRPPPPPKLSEAQKGTVQEILSQFDSENLSAEDAEAINEAFREAGIRPSADLKSEIEAAGFDASALRPPGGPGGNGGPPPPPPPGSEDELAISALFEILEEYQGETLDEEALADINAKFREAGFSGSNGSLISITV